MLPEKLIKMTIIKIRKDTKQKLKSLFPTKNFDKIIEELIYSHNITIFLHEKAFTEMTVIKDTLAWTPTSKGYNYNHVYRLSSSNYTSIKISELNKRDLDLKCQALYEKGKLCTYNINSGTREYDYNGKLGKLVKKKQSYDEIINELIDTYKPYIDFKYNPIQFEKDQNGNIHVYRYDGENNENVLFYNDVLLCNYYYYQRYDLESEEDFHIRLEVNNDRRNLRKFCKNKKQLKELKEEKKAIELDIFLHPLEEEIEF